MHTKIQRIREKRVKKEKEEVVIIFEAFGIGQWDIAR